MSEYTYDPGVIIVPRGDDMIISASSFSGEVGGDLYHLSNVSEIVFAVADEVEGVVRIIKRLSDGDITVTPDGYQFYFTVTSDDTFGLVRNLNYYEIRAVLVSGAKKTIGSGVFKSPQTVIKDL